MYSTYKSIQLKGTNNVVGTGWLPPRPDFRDYTDSAPAIAEMTKKLGLTANKNDGNKNKGNKFTPKPSPAKVDLRSWCSPIENQKNLGSCSSHAAVGIVEYFQRRAFGKHIEGSHLFVYKATRNLMQVTGDTGAWLRNTMGALVLCGVPDEKYWPYTDAKPDFDAEPSSFVYSVANNFSAVKYFCHDPFASNLSGDVVLSKIKSYLIAGVPSMFGFFGFPSSSMGDIPGGIPYPAANESSIWGHAVVAVGYDDGKKIKNPVNNVTTTGALLFRNSWGTEWGEQGYGWLPYDFVKNRLAMDFWSLLQMDWIDTNEFGI